MPRFQCVLFLVVCVNVTWCFHDDSRYFTSLPWMEPQCATGDLRTGVCSSNCTTLTPQQRRDERNICRVEASGTTFFCCPKVLLNSSPYPVILQACLEREATIKGRLELQLVAKAKLFKLEGEIFTETFAARQHAATRFYRFSEVCKKEADKIGGKNTKDEKRNKYKEIFNAYCRSFERPAMHGFAASPFPAKLGEFPYMAALGWTNSHNITSWQCGGTLIHTSFVLTATHCLSNIGVLPNIVRVGDVDLTTDDDDKYCVEFDIEQVFFHDQYDNRTFYNDIALLKVKKQSYYRNKYTPLHACVWLDNEFPVKKLGLLGYGAPAFGRSFTERLYKGGLSTLKNEECAVRYGDNDNVPNGIQQTQICAFDPQGILDTCQGDSGGPLQFTVLSNKGIILKMSSGFLDEHKDTVPYIAAITSFGGLCLDGTPGVYTRVFSFLDWIEKILRENQ